MPIKASAKKELRKSKKRYQRNLKIKKELIYLQRKFKRFLEAKDKIKAQEFYQKLQKKLDKAAKKGVIKKNTSARKKSRLAKRLNQLLKTN